MDFVNWLSSLDLDDLNCTFSLRVAVQNFYVVKDMSSVDLEDLVLKPLPVKHQDYIDLIDDNFNLKYLPSSKEEYLSYLLKTIKTIGIKDTVNKERDKIDKVLLDLCDMKMLNYLGYHRKIAGRNFKFNGRYIAETILLNIILPNTLS